MAIKVIKKYVCDKCLVESEKENSLIDVPNGRESSFDGHKSQYDTIYVQLCRVCFNDFIKTVAEEFKSFIK